MIERFKLIEGYISGFWRLWSFWMNSFWAAFIAWLASDPANMEAFKALFPESIHPVVGPFIGFAIFASQFWARGAQQRKPK